MRIGRALLVICSPLLGIATAAEPDGLLRAEPDSQLEQNRKADAEDLSRMADLAMVRRFARLGLLQTVPASSPTYALLGPSALRYLRPWARLFLKRLSEQFHARFGARLRVTSLTRTVAYQRRLRGRNGNAAPAVGEERSSHLTGASLDISKRFMTTRQIDWMRRVLHSLAEANHLHAVEEFAQPTFHVMVHRSYLDYVRLRTAAE
jgi:hypothetical protein